MKETKRSAPPKEGENREDDGGRMADVAKHKAQVMAMEKISKHHQPVTLPEGVTLRDPPMVKTAAFLSKVPNLA